MKRTILLYAFLTALLMVAVKLFEISLFTGELSMKLYVFMLTDPDGNPILVDQHF